MKHLLKIRLIMLCLFFSTTSLMYWVQVAQRVRPLDPDVANGRVQRQILSVEQLQRMATPEAPYTYDENVTSSNFSRPDFAFLKQPKHIYKPRCRGFTCVQLIHNVSWTMVNFVKSKASNTAHRNDIRRTWALRSYLNESRFETVFVVGLTRNETTEAQLNKEHQEFGDILQYDGPDDYKYVPLKTLAGMQWASKNLPKNFLYSSGDDDVMVKIDRFKRVIDYYYNMSTTENWPEFPIICTYRTMELTRPYRNRTGRYRQWFVSEREYKWPFFPRGCFGGFYSTSMHVVAQLSQLARKTPYLRVDDVWITGILRSRLQMPDYMVIKPKEKIAFHGVGIEVSKVSEKLLKKELELHLNETAVDKSEVVPIRSESNIETS